MKRIYRVYKKTVSIVNETATGMYRNLVGKKKGFLLDLIKAWCLQEMGKNFYHSQECCLNRQIL